jgi:predicted nucleic acid-binding protein
MIFANIPQGSRVFLDANTLIYHAGADPTYGPACKQLVERIARREVEGYTSAHVLGDVAHRLMTLEAIASLGWAAKGIVSRLRHNPAEVQKLTRFRQAIDDVGQMGLHVLPLDFSAVSAAAVLSQQYGLLTGDALIVAVMQQHRLTDLASNDADFDRVPGLTRYAGLIVLPSRPGLGRLAGTPEDKPKED